MPDPALTLGASPAFKDLFPWFTAWWAQAIVVTCVYAITVAFSGRLVRAFVGEPRAEASPSSSRKSPDAGAVIGKCENILTVTMVLMGEFQGLGIIVGAKTIARLGAVHGRSDADPSDQPASYYLGGTLVNITWSIVCGLTARVLVVGV